MLHNLVRLLIDLVATPKESWERLFKSNMTQDRFLKEYFYPLLAIASVSVFLGMLKVDSVDLQYCIKMFIVVVVRNFVGYRLAIFLYDEMMATLFGQQRGTSNAYLFIGGNLLVVISIYLVVGLLPSLSILSLLPLYVINVIWKGAQYFVANIEESGRSVLFTSLTSLIVLGSPWLIGEVMKLFLPGI